MNKDLIVGIVLSLSLHSGIYFFSHKTAAPKHVAAQKEEVMQFEMPPPEEEKQDKVEELNDEPVQNQIAPPSLVDLPSVVPVNAFTQPLQPPPPPGLTPSKGAITIPVNKPGANFGSGIKDLFNVGDLDQKPVAQVRVQPTYPYEMSRAGITGNVTVEFIINTNGEVTQAQATHSSHREFEVPAVQAVLKWRFKPGRKGGRAVNTRASQLLEFTLDDNK